MPAALCPLHLETFLEKIIIILPVLCLMTPEFHFIAPVMITSSVRLVYIGATVVWLPVYDNCSLKLCQKLCFFD